MKRTAQIERKTSETDIKIDLLIDGSGVSKINTGIPFFDHMLILFSAHGFFDLEILAEGDLEVDFHHTVEDVGIVLGDVFKKALGDRKGIKRYGFAVTPMDETLTEVSIDLSNRPFLVFNVPQSTTTGVTFDTQLAKEFFRAFSNSSGMNLHINVRYGENEHHILESIFKALGRALDQGTILDQRVKGIRSTKGIL
jgi:imidazoleglycerol-phosphate dehydratase